MRNCPPELRARIRELYAEPSLTISRIAALCGVSDYMVLKQTEGMPRRRRLPHHGKGEGADGAGRPIRALHAQIIADNMAAGRDLWHGIERPTDREACNG